MSRVFDANDPGNQFRRTDAPPAKLGGLFKTDSDDGQSTFTDGQGNKYWFVDTTAGDVTVTLPNAAEVTPDTIFTVKRTTAGANNLYVTTGGGLVDGAVSQNIISQYACYAYISDGENYWVSGVGSGEGSVSISAMITTRLAIYITSASVATAIAPFITSASVATALAPYVTSNSVSIALATKQPNFSVADEGVTLSTVAGTVTNINFVGTGISASLTGGILTVTSASSGGGFNVADEGVTLTAVAGAVSLINFVGTGISASLTGGILTVTSAAGTGSGEGSVSISSMITTALGPYITSASVATALGSYVTSTSLATALGAYVTSGSLNTALATYLTSNSFSAAIANYATSNSVSIMIGSRLTSYITSASVATALATYLSSSSFATAIAPYLTSASFATAIAPYVTSASLVTTLGGYVTSTSLATALGTYLTSNSASIALAAKQPNFSVADEGVTLSTVAGTVTTINFVGTGISASLTGGLLTVTAVAGAGSGEGSVSVSTMISTALGGGYTGTASFAAITLAGRPVGAVLLGYQTLSNVNSFGFSGSWSDFCVLQCQALYRIETGTSATASAAIYSDGGTTPFLNLATASNTQSANQIIAVDYTVYGGNARPIKLMRVNGTTGTNLQRVAATATANTAFVNALKYFSSATMTAGMAVLYGWRTS